jgi:hypothetical protein
MTSRALSRRVRRNFLRRAHRCECRKVHSGTTVPETPEQPGRVRSLHGSSHSAVFRSDTVKSRHCSMDGTYADVTARENAQRRR